MEREFLKKAAILHPTEVMHPYDRIIKQVGFDAVFTFAEQVGGLTIYVPSAKKIFSRCLELEAKKEFNGENFADIAKKYGYTERHMKRLLYGEPGNTERK